MKLNKIRILFGIIFLAALVALVPMAQAHGCTMRDVCGDYGYATSGTIVTPPVGTFGAVGHVTFTETGTFSGAQTTNIAGNFFCEAFTGTFNVNPDCTAMAVVNVYRGTILARTTNLNLVWDDDQRETRAIFLTAGTAVTITAKRMSHKRDD